MSVAATAVEPAASGTPLDQATDPQDLRVLWRRRIVQAKEKRKPFERIWHSNLAFIQGKHWLEWSRAKKTLVLPAKNERYAEAVFDLLTQYRMTALGELSADDDRPELLFRHEEISSTDYARLVNDALGYGWDHEWHGDERLMELKLKLVDLGTAALQVHFDSNVGPVKLEAPLDANGRPILDLEKARSYVAENSQSAKVRDIREGLIRWEVLSPFELLPPPGVENPEDFPWEVVVRAQPIRKLVDVYGSKAEGLQSEPLAPVGQYEAPDRQNDEADGVPTALDGWCFVYTCFERPGGKFPQGYVLTLAGKDLRVLDFHRTLPYTAPDGTPRSGVTYFTYWPVTGRFWGRSLVEAGKGIQRVYNKRRTQIGEIIDRGLPKVFVREGDIRKMPSGAALEVVELKREAPAPTVDQGVAPGQWFYADLEQLYKDLEHAIGIRSVSLGENPAGVANYSQLALLRENDQIKLNPLLSRLKSGTKEVVENTVADIRTYWGQEKLLTLAGEDGAYRAKTFDATKIPPFFLVSVAKGAARPRTQAAQLKLIEDVARYSVETRQPLPPRWYADSLRAGALEQMPEEAKDAQLEKAKVENSYLRQGAAIDVQDYDDPMVHIAEHRDGQIHCELEGNEEGQHAFQAHIDAHLEMERQKAAQQMAQQQAVMPPAAPGQPPAPQPAAPGTPPAAPPAGPPV